jgi:peptidoglycan/LPS O-acetylase OafA/YrhL
MPKRIPGLDGIRAISIFLVLFAHLTDGFWWSHYGNFGVDCFFVLSGFLITWLLCVEEDKQGAISLPAFYVRRALRILPPALLCVTIVSLLAIAGLAIVAHNEIFYCIFFVRNLMHLGGTHIGHFWSLAIEEQFYLLWPLAFLLLRSNRRRLVFSVALFIAAPFWRHLDFLIEQGAGWPNRFDLRYDALMAGCCLALLRYDPQLRGLASSRVLRSTPTALVALATIVAGCAGLPRGVFAASLSFVGVAAFINFAVERETGAIGGFLNWRPIIWVGQLSYSLYLWQQIFCYRSKLPWLGRFPQNVIAAFAAAALSYYLLEQPLAEVRKRLRYAPNLRLFFYHVRPAADQVSADESIAS